MGLLLCPLLLFAGTPAIFATETFRSFDGTNYVEVPSTPTLQLTQFVIEANFRFAQAHTEWAYLLNKPANNTGKTSIDLNYALFLTPANKLGGGFRAEDGTYHYVYSGTISMNTWHLAKLVYDGTKLRLSVDGTAVAAKTVSKNPDSSSAGPLRIGANAHEPTRLFIGDLDYVKIVDRITFKQSYYNDFDDVTPPPPPPATECSQMPVDQLRGVNLIDPILARFESDDRIGGPGDFVPESMEYLKMYGFNFVRVPYYWESYVSWPAAFMSEIELIAQEAEKNDICVVYDFHHWFGSSYWNTTLDKPGKSKGFPSFVVDDFPSQSDYDSTAGPFWTAFFRNEIVVDGKSVWDSQADFMKLIINKVDGYDSVGGYEILNEPHLFNSSQYDDLGSYHTYMALEIREVSDKKIYFDREITRGFQRDPNSEYKIVPQGVNGLVYSPHLYAVPEPGSGGERQVDNFVQWAEDWGVEVMLGEFSAKTQDEMTTFLKAWKDAGFGWTYWKWSSSTTTAGGDLLGNVLYDSDNTAPTTHLKYMINSLKAVYG